MSKISECLKQILSARYGKDVRQSIHDSIQELDEVARTAQGSATLSAQTAIEKANEALTASQAAIESAKQAKAYSDNAQAVAGVSVATQDTAGLVKGGENHIGLDGTLELVVKTTEASMPNSRKGRLVVDEIGGVCVQDNIPSPDYPQEIKKSVVSEIRTHGNQLFDVDAVNVGKFILDTGGLYDNSYWNTSDFIKVSALTNYCVSQSEKVHFHYRIGFYGADKKIIRVDAIENSNITKYTFITPENTEYIRVCYSTNISGATIDRGNIMVNAGNTDLPWEPYTESVVTLSQPIELYGIGDVQDVIEGGKVVRKFKKYTFTGGETWNSNLHPSSGIRRFYVTFPDIKEDTLNKRCNFARATSWSAMQTTLNCCGVYDTFFGLTLDTIQNFTTSAEVNAYIKSLETPIECFYELAEEVIEELPLADQIALNSLETFEGTTYIEFDSEVQPTFAGKYGAGLVGGAALEGAMKANANALILKGDSFEIAEHGLTFKGLKIGKMVTVQVSGAIDYGITEENKVKTFASVIPEGFRPISTTHTGCFSITSNDSSGNRLTNMFDLGVGGSGAIQLQVELKDSEGKSITTSSAGMPLNMAISYISE